MVAGHARRPRSVAGVAAASCVLTVIAQHAAAHAMPACRARARGPTPPSPGGLPVKPSSRRAGAVLSCRPLPPLWQPVAAAALVNGGRSGDSDRPTAIFAVGWFAISYAPDRDCGKQSWRTAAVTCRSSGDHRGRLGHRRRGLGAGSADGDTSPQAWAGGLASAALVAAAVQLGGAASDALYWGRGHPLDARRGRLGQLPVALPGGPAWPTPVRPPGAAHCAYAEQCPTMPPRDTSSANRRGGQPDRAILDIARHPSGAALAGRSTTSSVRLTSGVTQGRAGSVPAAVRADRGDRAAAEPLCCGCVRTRARGSEELVRLPRFGGGARGLAMTCSLQAIRPAPGVANEARRLGGSPTPEGFMRMLAERAPRRRGETVPPEAAGAGWSSPTQDDSRRLLSLRPVHPAQASFKSLAAVVVHANT
jgi:hypothetical protein